MMLHLAPSKRLPLLTTTFCWSSMSSIAVRDQKPSAANMCVSWHTSHASGGGRKRSARATQDASLANLQWRLFSYWSGEHPLDSRFLGEARERGEMVRLIELPVPKPKRGGIFDRMAGVELSTADLAKKVEDAVQANFGHPIRAFIHRVAEDPQTCTAQAHEQC
jgi:hypothetical protein